MQVIALLYIGGASSASKLLRCQSVDGERGRLPKEFLAEKGGISRGFYSGPSEICRISWEFHGDCFSEHGVCVYQTITTIELG